MARTQLASFTSFPLLQPRVFPPYSRMFVIAFVRYTPKRISQTHFPNAFPKRIHSLTLDSSVLSLTRSPSSFFARPLHFVLHPHSIAGPRPNPAPLMDYRRPARLLGRRRRRRRRSSRRAAASSEEGRTKRCTINSRRGAAKQNLERKTRTYKSILCTQYEDEDAATVSRFPEAY